ncbi:Mor transcription activator family protein [Kingella negevensis]|uniref:Mor transcription activator family protein n=1 Tax=Kingella negevensis TaxID=1522312 RepID=UPI0021518D32|nr:Mor transcription activator family protein [Kingella negevensis]MDK4679618.1 Mor transcription activator family protein [Kingella negevensis]MDK4682663.1 Mor transcription activator family protein [Kingella negevensis]MDK4684206.1 Mor transcription activator family protein [Kingella negevensis]MDK4690860.1 Mor transcription activator family protein [Kingella negevensis]MDK4693993.1 Mor transcription activator family protein [Kingella negevensis]
MIEESVSHTLTERGLPPNIVAAALSVANKINETFAGQLVYFKTGAKNNAEERRLALIADFETGNYSHVELAKKHRISLQRVYAILKQNNKD